MLTFFNKLVSYTLHPVIFPTIGSFLYFFLTPGHFSSQQKNIILLVIFLGTYLLPLLMLLVLKRFNAITSYHLKTIEERKFPIVFLAVVSLMMGRMLLRTQAADLLAYSFIGGAIALVVTYLLLFKNIKTSLHTMGIGSLIGLIMSISIEYKINYTGIIAFLFILFGLLAYSRLYLKAHSPLEVYLGLIIGIFSQLLGYQLL